MRSRFGCGRTATTVIGGERVGREVTETMLEMRTKAWFCLSRSKDWIGRFISCKEQCHVLQEKGRSVTCRLFAERKPHGGHEVSSFGEKEQGSFFEPLHHLTRKDRDRDTDRRSSEELFRVTAHVSPSTKAPGASLRPCRQGADARWGRTQCGCIGLESCHETGWQCLACNKGARCFPEPMSAGG